MEQAEEEEIEIDGESYELSRKSAKNLQGYILKISYQLITNMSYDTPSLDSWGSDMK